MTFKKWRINSKIGQISAGIPGPRLGQAGLRLVKIKVTGVYCSIYIYSVLHNLYDIYYHWALLPLNLSFGHKKALLANLTRNKILFFQLNVLKFFEHQHPKYSVMLMLYIFVNNHSHFNAYREQDIRMKHLFLVEAHQNVAFCSG